MFSSISNSSATLYVFLSALLQTVRQICALAADLLPPGIMKRVSLGSCESNLSIIVSMASMSLSVIINAASGLSASVSVAKYEPTTNSLF